MERRFPTLAEAEQHAADLRQQGYLASVCDESSATLWGPATTNGFRVVVSESTGENSEEVPSPSRAAELVQGILRFAFIGVLVTGAIWFALEFTAFLVHGGLLPTVFTIAAVALLVYSLAAWSLLVAALFRKQRDRGSALGLLIHAVISCLVGGLIVTLIVVA